MSEKRFFSGTCSCISCVWFFTYKLLADQDEIQFFERCDVTRQISIGDVQHFFEGRKIDGVIDHQNGHDPESYATFKGFIDMFDVIFHCSYLKYMMVP